jgi:hypothetical protein
MARCQWLTSVILAPQEAEIRRILVWNQAGQRVFRTLSQKNPSQKRSGGVAQGISYKFKPSTKKNKHQLLVYSSLVMTLSLWIGETNLGHWLGTILWPVGQKLGHICVVKQQRSD